MAVTPVYQSEVSSAAQRGWQVCCQLTTMLFGLMLAYWINYGFFYQQSSVQWRFPLAFQMVFAIYCICVTVFLPDTPRWLLRYGTSPEQGTAVLARLRDKPVDHPSVQREKDDIMDAIEIESREEGSWLDLFRGAGIAADKRFYLALGIQFMQQMSGEWGCRRVKGTITNENEESMSSPIILQHCSKRALVWASIWLSF